MLEEVSQTVMREAQLLERIREGDNAAFAELYTAYKQRVYLYCLRFLGDDAAAEDVFQDVFLGFLQRARDGQNFDSVCAYLIRCARNSCLNRIRDRKFTRDVEAIDREHWDDRLERELEEIEVRKALARLPERRREALVLREYAGLTYNEIAELFGASPSAIANLIYLARKQMHTILSQDTWREQES